MTTTTGFSGKIIPAPNRFNQSLCYGAGKYLVAPEATNVMKYSIELCQEEDGRWIAEVIELPGVLVYGASQQEALLKAKVLTLQVLADMVEHNEISPSIDNIMFCTLGVIA